MKHTYKFALSLTVVGGLTFVASEHIHNAYAAEMQSNPTQTVNNSKADNSNNETPLASHQAQVNDASNHTETTTPSIFNKADQNSDVTHNASPTNNEESGRAQSESSQPSKSTTDNQQQSQVSDSHLQPSAEQPQESDKAENETHPQSEGQATDQARGTRPQQEPSTQGHQATQSQQDKHTQNDHASETQHNTSSDSTDTSDEQQNRPTSSQPMFRATSNAETPEATSAPMENTKTTTIKMWSEEVIRHKQERFVDKIICAKV